MQTKSRFDPNSPEIKAYLNELAHQFVREGIMVAFSHVPAGHDYADYPRREPHHRARH